MVVVEAQAQSVAIQVIEVVKSNSQQEREIVVSRIKRQALFDIQRMHSVYDGNFDPRDMRIKHLTAPILKAWRFKRVSKNRWRGTVNGIPLEVEIPKSYPVEPPILWLYRGKPRNFHHVVYRRGKPVVCMEKTVYATKWTPETTIDNLLTNLECQPTFHK